MYGRDLEDWCSSACVVKIVLDPSSQPPTLLPAYHRIAMSPSTRGCNASDLLRVSSCDISATQGVNSNRAGTWAVPFLDGPRHDHLARPKARHGMKYFGPCRYDTNTRAVPCLEFQHDGLYGTTRILGRAWAGTARKQPIGHYVAPCSIMTVNLPF